MQLDLARTRQLGLGKLLLDLGFGRAVEYRRREVQAQLCGGPAEVRFQNLTDVHTGRNAERIQHDLDRRSIRQIRHVLFRNDARDDTLVSVAAGHLVADRKLALHRDVDFTSLITPGGSSSPLRSLAIFSSVIFSSTAI